LWLQSVRYGCPLLHCLMFRLMTGQSGHTASACQQLNSPGFKRSDLTAHTHQHPKKKLFKSRGYVLNGDIDQESLGCCLWSSPWGDAAKRLCLATHCPVILTLLWPSITYNILMVGFVGCVCVCGSVWCFSQGGAPPFLYLVSSTKYECAVYTPLLVLWVLIFQQSTRNEMESNIRNGKPKRGKKTNSCREFVWATPWVNLFVPFLY
jgi:hypothetical protein